MRIAVTGGSGEMGRALVPYLLEQGHSVVSIDRALPSTTIFSLAGQAQFMAANVTNFGEYVACLRGCDGLIHLAAHRSPMSHADHVVFNENSAGNYNALSAAATVGIKRVCLASSINAIGGVFSRQPRYDYFPLDEQHPAYPEDPYSLSKWVGEQQADAFARRFEDMSIASMRFHGLIDTRERALERAARYPMFGWRDLWAYTLLSEAARACLLALTADFKGHEAFYIVAPLTAKTTPSADLAHEHFPGTPFRSELPGTQGFFSCAKAERILGWVHTAE